MKTKYYFLIKEKENKKLATMTCYDIDKTQGEMDEIVTDFNGKMDGYQFHEQVTEEPMLSIVKKALEWKSNKTLEDILDKLDDVCDEVNDARNEIEDFIRERQKASGTQETGVKNA